MIPEVGERAHELPLRGTSRLAAGAGPSGGLSGRPGAPTRPGGGREYQGASGIKIRDASGGIRGLSVISGSQAPLGNQGTSGISGTSGIRIRDGGIRFPP